MRCVVGVVGVVDDDTWWSFSVAVDVVIIPLVVVDNTLDANDFSVVAVALSVEINSSVAVDIKVCVVAVVMICV